MPWSPMARSRKLLSEPEPTPASTTRAPGKMSAIARICPRPWGDHGGAAGHGQDVVGEQGAQREVRDVSRGSDNTALGSTDQLVVREGTLVGVEVLSGFERERVVAALGVGELDLVPDLEGPASAGGTGRFGHVTSLAVFPRAPADPGRLRLRAPAMAATKARSTSAVDRTP